MAEPAETKRSPATQIHQADAAANALHRLTDSLEEFLQYRSIYTEAAEVKRLLSQKEAEIKRKDERIKQLDSAISVITHSGQKEVQRTEVEKAEVLERIKKLDVRLAQALKENQEVQEQLKRTKKLLDDKAKEADQLSDRISRSMSREKELVADIQNLNKHQVELEKYRGYAANLVDLDMDAFSNRMENIWKNTQILVDKCFSFDTPVEALENDQIQDTWTQNACTFLKQPVGLIRIPSTNSPAAKLARKAVMLNVLAVLFGRWIFTATPQPFIQASLDEVLLKLLEQDESKEALCRAVLLSAIGNDPPQDDEFQRLAKMIWTLFGSLLPPKAQTDWKNGLKSLIKEATVGWIKSRFSRRKIIAAVEYEMCPGSWKDLPVPKQKVRGNVQNAEASDPEDGDEPFLIGFPAIIALHEGTRETVFRGSLIRYSHMSVAETEWQEERGRRRFSRGGVPALSSRFPLLRGATGATV